MTGGGAHRPIGYYVHHHGSGHAAHAVAVAGEVGTRLVGLGSGTMPDGWPGPWVALPRDDDPTPGGDPTRGGSWHWVPPQHPGFAARMQAIARWVGESDPVALVSDVSVEVAVLAELLGVGSVPVLLHGRRDDRPHRLVFDTAAAILAPWPASHVEPWHERWAPKLHPIGLMSRHDGRPSLPPPAGDRRILVVLPGGGHDFEPEAVEAAAQATAAKGWSWDVVGATGPPGGTAAVWHGHVDDVWPHLRAASVVVAAAGAGTVADVAAARRPAVLFPQRRPFDEQEALARHLDGRAPVRICSSWPTLGAWPDLLEEVAALDVTTWSDMHDGHAARRAAAVIGQFGSQR